MKRIDSEFTPLVKLFPIIISSFFFLLLLWVFFLLKNVWAIVILVALGCIFYGFYKNFWLKLSKIEYDKNSRKIHVEPEGITIPIESIQKIRTEFGAFLEFFPLTIIEYKREDNKPGSIHFIARRSIFKTKIGNDIISYFDQ
ncbi:MAG TPA: hypothetical protein DIW47_01810 [Bacteroidetes bacterium]|nr:hypothetical protein [Bacteroidota bacterium]